MTKKHAEPPGNERRRVGLHLGVSFADSWEGVILPWFESLSGFPPTQAPAAVVTPFRSLAYLLRGKLLARGISLLGIKFLSPAQLRETLLPGQSQYSFARTSSPSPGDRGGRCCCAIERKQARARPAGAPARKIRRARSRSFSARARSTERGRLDFGRDRRAGVARSRAKLRRVSPRLRIRVRARGGPVRSRCSGKVATPFQQLARNGIRWRALAALASAPRCRDRVGGGDGDIKRSPGRSTRSR